jgi:membrane-bound lytic murein transglycosylase MltF
LIRTTIIAALLTLGTTPAFAQTPPAKTSPSPTAGKPTPKAVTTLPTEQQLYTGDLDGMIKRRQIRVLTTYNKTGFFIDKGVQRGVTYDAFTAFEDQLNKKLKTGNLRVHVVFLPVGRDELADALLKGRGDIVAANITVSEARLEQVDFAAPVLDDVKEVVVTGPDAPAIATLDDLAGQTVHIRVQSLYKEHLAALSDSMVKAGKKPITIKELPANLEDEDILQMTSAGLVKITVVDDFLANFWKQILPALNVHGTVAVKEGQQVAWAMRKGSPQLKAELDPFVKANRLGTTMGNVIFTKYLKNTKFVKNSTSPAELKKFQTLLDLFHKYGDQYGVDWLLMAAQGYQESGLNQNVHSKVGAVGVMQVMPATGAELKVGDITQIEPNINAGVKYVRRVIDQNFKDEPMTPLDKGLMAFASYNAGPGRVKQLRAEAAKTGLNPNVWFNNVERVAAKRIGRETVQYVSNIYKYYVAYKLALEQMDERKQIKSTTGTE